MVVETPLKPSTDGDGVAAEEGPFAGLSVRGVTKSYSGNTVLSDIDLDVGAGEVVALLGENGAGKSTLAAIIAGIVPPDSGRMTWRGQSYAPATPGEAISRGVGLIHQEMRLLPDLSIAENVFVGRLPIRNGMVDREEMSRRAEKQIRRLGLDVSPATLVKSLRVAAQQQVEIAKALTLDAQLLILDEPTAALGEDETDKLFVQIERLKREGVSFIYVSHRLEEIGRIADKIAVLRDGRLVAVHESGKTPVKTLVEEMVGRSVERLFPDKTEPQDKEVLVVDGLSSAEGAFNEVSFSVRAGEVLGIAGIVGAGRSEVVRTIAGVDPVGAGTIRVDGREVQFQSPRDAIRAGIVFVPEDRKYQGLVLQHSLAENLAYGNYDRLAPSGWVKRDKVARFAADSIQRMTIRGTPRQLVGRLSGGNQQKALIARWMSRNPKVLILDEPTRGIDVGSRAEIYDVIAALSRTGMAVVVVSSDLEEVVGLSHRVMVLSKGRQRGILSGKEANKTSIIELATT